MPPMYPCLWHEAIPRMVLWWSTWQISSCYALLSLLWWLPRRISSFLGFTESIPMAGIVSHMFAGAVGSCRVVYLLVCSLHMHPLPPLVPDTRISSESCVYADWSSDAWSQGRDYRSCGKNPGAAELWEVERTESWPLRSFLLFEFWRCWKMFDAHVHILYLFYHIDYGLHTICSYYTFTSEILWINI